MRYRKKTLQQEQPFPLQWSSLFLGASVSTLPIKRLCSNRMQKKTQKSAVNVETCQCSAHTLTSTTVDSDSAIAINFTVRKIIRKYLL